MALCLPLKGGSVKQEIPADISTMNNGASARGSRFFKAKLALGPTFGGGGGLHHDVSTERERKKIYGTDWHQTAARHGHPKTFCVSSLCAEKEHGTAKRRRRNHFVVQLVVA